MLLIHDPYYAKKTDDLNWDLVERRVIEKPKNPARIGETVYRTISHHATLEGACEWALRLIADDMQRADVQAYIDDLRGLIEGLKITVKTWKTNDA